MMGATLHKYTVTVIGPDPGILEVVTPPCPLFFSEVELNKGEALFNQSGGAPFTNITTATVIDPDPALLEAMIPLKPPVFQSSSF